MTKKEHLININISKGSSSFRYDTLAFSLINKSIILYLIDKNKVVIDLSKENYKLFIKGVEREINF